MVVLALEYLVSRICWSICRCSAVTDHRENPSAGHHHQFHSVLELRRDGLLRLIVLFRAVLDAILRERTNEAYLVEPQQLLRLHRALQQQGHAHDLLLDLAGRLKILSVSLALHHHRAVYALRGQDCGRYLMLLNLQDSTQRRTSRSGRISGICS